MGALFSSRKGYQVLAMVRDTLGSKQLIATSQPSSLKPDISVTDTLQLG